MTETSDSRFDLTIPISNDRSRWVYVNGPRHLTEKEWALAAAILDAMRPGVVRTPVSLVKQHLRVPA